MRRVLYGLGDQIFRVAASVSATTLLTLSLLCSGTLFAIACIVLLQGVAIFEALYAPDIQSPLKVFLSALNLRDIESRAGEAIVQAAVQIAVGLLFILLFWRYFLRVHRYEPPARLTALLGSARLLGPVTALVAISVFAETGAEFVESAGKAENSGAGVALRARDFIYSAEQAFLVVADQALKAVLFDVLEVFKVNLADKEIEGFATLSFAVIFRLVASIYIVNQIIIAYRNPGDTLRAVKKALSVRYTEGRLLIAALFITAVIAVLGDGGGPSSIQIVLIWAAMLYFILGGLAARLARRLQARRTAPV